MFAEREIFGRGPSIGRAIRAVRWGGVSGALRSAYYSKRHTGRFDRLLVSKNTSCRIAKSATFDLPKRLVVGAYSYEVSNPAVHSSYLHVKSGGHVGVTGQKAAILGSGTTLYVGSDASFEIGGSFVNATSNIVCEDAITIGDDCAIAWDVDIMDTDRHQVVGSDRTDSVEIQDEVWIAHGASIQKGVTVGEGAIIAADATVVDDVPPRSVVAGVPAKPIKNDVYWRV